MADDTQKAVGIAALIAIIPTTITALAALIPTLTKGERARGRRRIIALVLGGTAIVLALLAGALLYESGKDAGTTTATTTTVTVAKVSLAQYRQKIGAICDDRDITEQQLKQAESNRDDRAVLIALKTSEGQFVRFQAEKPPAERKDDRQTTLELWRREQAARTKLINAMLRVPAGQAMAVALTSPEAKEEKRLSDRLDQQLNDLVGSECSFS
jgi:hypothetical protein